MQQLHLRSGRHVVAVERFVAGLERERCLVVELLEVAHLGVVLGEASAHGWSRLSAGCTFRLTARCVFRLLCIYPVKRKV